MQLASLDEGQGGDSGQGDSRLLLWRRLRWRRGSRTRLTRRGGGVTRGRVGVGHCIGVEAFKLVLCGKRGERRASWRKVRARTSIAEGFGI